METSKTERNNNQADSEMDNRKTNEEIKKTLKKQISELKLTIQQLQKKLGVCTFKDVENALVLTDPSEQNETTKAEDARETLDIETELEYELYRYAGFYCTKVSDVETICNFSPSIKYEKDNTFCIQILSEDDNIEFGKWVLPMCADLDELVHKFFLEDRNVPQFYRSCKHYIDCYFMRREQFNSLKDSVFDTKKFNLQANLGYTWITLQLKGVHGINDEASVDVTVYLVYNITEVRPYKLEVDLTPEDTSSINTKHLKRSFKVFKMFDLSTAFNNMFNETPFAWAKEDEDTPIEMNGLSRVYEDEEGFLQDFEFPNKQSSASRKRKKKNMGQHISKVFKLIEQVASQSENSDAENGKLVLRKNKVKPKAQKQMRLKLQNNNLKLQAEGDTSSSAITSPKKTINKKLHEPSTSTSSKTEQNPSERIEKLHKPSINTSLKIKQKPSKHVDKLLEPSTSTPLKSGQNPFKHIAIHNFEYTSDITVNEDNSSNTKTKSNIEQSEPDHNRGTENIVPTEMLKGKMKKNLKLLTGPKSNVSKKNLSHKRKI